MLVIPSTFERTLVYRIVSYRIKALPVLTSTRVLVKVLGRVSRKLLASRMLCHLWVN